MFLRRIGSVHRRPLSLTPNEIEDLKWFKLILGDSSLLQGVPFTQLEENLEVDRDIFMDASGMGFCALDLELQQYTRREYSDEEKALFVDDESINVRDLASSVFAFLVWGHLWRRPDERTAHVRLWIDNSSAVAWTNKRSSPSPFGQLLLRLLSLGESVHNLHITAATIQKWKTSWPTRIHGHGDHPILYLIYGLTFLFSGHR